MKSFRNETLLLKFNLFELNSKILNGIRSRYAFSTVQMENDAVDGLKKPEKKKTKTKNIYLIFLQLQNT